MSWVEDDGFTLVEFLTAMALLTVVLAAITPGLFAGSNQTNRQADRVTTLDDLRVAVDRINKEVRQACTVSPATGAAATSITLQIKAASAGGAADCSGSTVIRTDVIDCGVPAGSTRTCTLAVTTATGTQTSNVVQGLSSNSRFIPSASAGANGRQQVQIYLEKAPESGTRPVALSANATLRYIS